jgi:hypothetical protein
MCSGTVSKLISRCMGGTECSSSNPTVGSIVPQSVLGVSKLPTTFVTACVLGVPAIASAMAREEGVSAVIARKRVDGVAASSVWRRPIF